MDDNSVCRALIEFIGLDEESTKTQILPYLKSLKTKVEIEDYLTSLIGSGQKQCDFIQRLCKSINRSKVENIKNTKNETAFPSLPSTQNKSQSSSFPHSAFNKSLSSMNSSTKGKKTQSSSKKQSNVENNQTVNPTVFNNFANPANVYLKPKDSDNNSSTSSSSKKKNPISTTSEPATLEPKPNLKNNITDPKPQATTTKDSKSDLSLDIDIPISELSPKILKEIFQIKLILESIETPQVFPKGTAQCFCQARDHGQPLNNLPKQCFNCGLVFCGLKPALSPCPSCNESSRLSTNSDLRERIRSEYVRKRNSLIQAEIEKYKKRLSAAEQKEALAREAERDYPTLPSKPSTSKKINSKARSYSNQLDGSDSIQTQIKLGYERLAKEFQVKNTSESGTTVSDSKSKSRTVVVRLHPNGQAKIITTTQKGVKDKQQEEIKIDQKFNLESLGIDMFGISRAAPYLDHFDDLFRIKSKSLDPVLFIENQTSPFVPMYVRHCRLWR